MPFVDQPFNPTKGFFPTGDCLLSRRFRADQHHHREEDGSWGHSPPTSRPQGVTKKRRGWGGKEKGPTDGALGGGTKMVRKVIKSFCEYLFARHNSRVSTTLGCRLEKGPIAGCLRANASKWPPPHIVDSLGWPFALPDLLRRQARALVRFPAKGFQIHFGSKMFSEGHWLRTLQMALRYPS